MLRQLLISKYPQISDKQFQTALQIATMDIKANRLAFGKRTTLPEALKIIGLCLITANKVENGDYRP